MLRAQISLHLMRCRRVRRRLATFWREVGRAALRAASGSRFSSFTMASATGALIASPSLYTWKCNLAQSYVHDHYTHCNWC